MNEITDIRFVSRVFTELGQRLVTSYTADLLIEYPNAVESLERGEVFTLLARRTGADDINRFRRALENPSASEEEAIKMCEQTLGWELEVKLHLNYTVEFKRNPHCSRFTEYELDIIMHDLKNSGINCFISN